MRQAIFHSLLLGGLFFATFSGSPNYQLKSYSIGPAATNNSSSTTYTLQGSAGEQANGSTSGSTDTANNGSIQTEQLNVPPAPTLSNGSSTYYNQLNAIVNTGSNPSDSTYAIAVSSNSFVTTNYVQASGILGSSQFYQSYSAWGSGSGSLILGLAPNTTYEVKVAAKEGLFTNTEFGAFASASTVNPTLTFSVSPSTENMGNLLPGSVVTSPSNISFTLSTNATNGSNIYVAGQYGGLNSPTQGYTITSATANLASASSGFGLQGLTASQSSGGPLSIVSPFNGSGNNVGAEGTTLSDMFTTSNPIVSGTATANIQAEASNSTPSANDYQEVLTFIAAASY